MAITSQQILDFLIANPGMSDAQIASAMDAYGVTPSQMAQAVGLPVFDIQQRYEAVQPQGLFATQVASPSPVVASNGVTNQQIVDFLVTNPGLTDTQIVSAMEQYGVSPAQMAQAVGIPEGEVISRVAATVPEGQAKLLGDTWVQPQYQVIGSGEDRQVGGIENVLTYKTTGGINDQVATGTDVKQYSSTGEYQQTTQTQAVDNSMLPFILGAAGLFGGIGGGLESLLGGGGAATVGSTGLTTAELAQLDLALGGAGGTAGATSLTNALGTGATVGTLTNLTGGSGVLTGTAGGTAGGTGLTTGAGGLGLTTGGGTGLTAGTSGLGGTLGAVDTGITSGLTGTGLATGGTGLTTGVTGMGGGTGLTVAGAGGLGGVTGATGLEGALGTGLTTAGAGGLGGATGAVGLDGALGAGLTVGGGLTGTGLLTGSELGSTLLGTGTTGALTGTGILTGSNLGTTLLGTGAGTGVTGGLTTGVGAGTGLGAGAFTTGVGAGLGTGLTGVTTGIGTGVGTGLATGLTNAATTGLGGLTAAQLGALLSSGLTLGGGLLQQQTSKEAAQRAQAMIDAETAAAKQAAQFRPVGMTTRFGTSQFQIDPRTGQLISAGYTLDAQAKNAQDRLVALAEQGLRQAESAQAQYAPLLTGAQSLANLGQGYLNAQTDPRLAQIASQYLGQSPESQRLTALGGDYLTQSPESKQLTALGAGYLKQSPESQRLTALGGQYLAQSPEQVAQNYMNQQLALLQPGRELELANLQNKLQQQGRGGLAVSQGGTYGATTPELQALYNARAMQEAQLAANAQQAGQQQVQFGAGLVGTGQQLGIQGQQFGANLIGTGQQLGIQGQQFGSNLIGAGQQLGIQGQQFGMNALANQQALEQQRLGFGSGLLSQGAGLMGQYYSGQQAAYQPYTTALGQIQGLETAAQQPLTMGINLGQLASQAGANVGKLGLAGAGESVALATGPAATTNPYASLLGGLGASPAFGTGIASLFS